MSTVARRTRPVSLRASARLAAGLLLSALIGLSAVGTGASAAQAADGKGKPPAAAPVVTFGVQPAFRGKPDARPFFRFGVTPGSLVNDELAIRNYSNRALSLRVYATDATNLATGGLSLLPSDQKAVDSGAWVTIGGKAAKQHLVHLAARSITTVPFTVQVPKDATPGDHVAGVVASLTTQARGTEGTAVQLDQRVGSRVFVRVSGPLTPSLTVEQLSAEYTGNLNPFTSGKTTITYRLRNNGNIALGATVDASVKGLVGPTARRKATGTTLLLPRGSLTGTVVVPGVWPAGRERATLRVTPLVLSGDTVAVTVVTRSVTFWAVPWAILAALVLILLVVLALVVRRVRRRRSRGGAPGGPSAITPSPSPDAAPASSPKGAGVAARRTAVGSLVAVGAVAVIVPLSATSAAAAAGYVDASSTGRITLCDKDNHPVTAGRVGARPFVTQAVGESHAVAGYDGEGRVAALFAFQPRRGTTPGEWSGMGLTANSAYSNAAHPMARFVSDDYSLSDFVTAYPPKWDGMVQLRMHLQAPGEPNYHLTYDSIDLKVTGDHWKVVGTPGKASCTAGKARSVADILGLVGKGDQPTTGSTADPATGAKTPGAAGSATTATGKTDTAVTPTTLATGTPVPGTDLAAASSRADSAASTTVSAWWWLAAVALVLLFAALIVRRRLSRSRFR